ncbi:MAG TPA: hypothetical protein DCP28_37980, partial [Cytophagales bacterium]|nr:hypothetical protein [Cytophagales bacterium]
MKYFGVLIFLLISSSSITFSSPLCHNQEPHTEQIYVVAKVWGFLKYYHPAVAAGGFAWDETLLTWLIAAQDLPDQAALQAYLANEIEKLGHVPPCTKCDNARSKDYTGDNFDLSWIGDSTLLGAELPPLLQHIEANRFQGTPYYVERDYAGQVKFINEPEYAESNWAESGYRLLHLIKFWNSVEYYYPYKYMADQPWNEVLRTMIPQFLNAPTEHEFILALRALTLRLDDSHTVLQCPQTTEIFGARQLPIRTSWIDNQVVITHLWDDSLAQINDLRVGDVILAYEGITVAERFATHETMYRGSNPDQKRKNSSLSLLRTQAPRANLTYERAGVVTQKQVNTYLREEINFTLPTRERWRSISPEIAYVDVTALEKDDLKHIVSEVWEHPNLIMDLRGYPNYILHSLGKQILPSRRNFVQIVIPDINYPGKFYRLDPHRMGPYMKRSGYQGRIFVLVNDDSQSLSEFTAMSLQCADQVTTLGHQTSGADGDVVRYTFYEGATTYITGIGIRYPDGTLTQRVGVQIDLQVRPTLEGIRAGRDAILEKAIELA